MDIRKWCNSSQRRSIRLGSKNNYNKKSIIDHESSPISPYCPSYKLRSWRVFWNKFIKREKMRKTFETAVSSCYSPVSNNPRRLVPYDPCSYLQNFDRGFAWDDHDHQPDYDDNLSRSFSFRFADPSNNKILV